MSAAESPPNFAGSALDGRMVTSPVDRLPPGQGKRRRATACIASNGLIADDQSTCMTVRGVGHVVINLGPRSAHGGPADDHPLEPSAISNETAGAA
jgi:hypothetical protein